MEQQKIVVAIPVRDEEAFIGRCLAALQAQSRPADAVILLLNNCTDRSAEICAQMQSAFARMDVLEVTLAPLVASAGEARRLALEYAARDVAGAEIILTTDADALPPANWVERHVAHIAAGAELVCGTIAMDAADAARIPARLHDEHEREAECLAALDELTAAIDPDPDDPWPRHQQHSGASLAFTVAALRRAGGAPHVAVGEDRALVEALRLVDARTRHATDICVTVSGRLEGRAQGGMAAAIRRRLAAPDVLADPAVEPAVDAYRRALARAALRDLWCGAPGGQALGADLLIGAPAVQRAVAQTKYFGQAWAQVQRASPVLQRRRVAVTDLVRETRTARALLAQLAERPAALEARFG